MGKGIVVFTDRPTTVDFIASLSENCDSEFEVHSNIDQALYAARMNKNLKALFLDVNEIEQIKSIEEKMRIEIDRNLVHLMVFPQDVLLNEEFLENNFAGHVVFKRMTGAKEDGAEYARIIRLTERSAASGLADFFEVGTEIQSFDLSESLQKGYATTAVALHLKENGANERVAESIAGAVDEMIMNAMFDAPTNETGQQKYQSTPRSEEISTPNVELQFCLENETIAIQVTDMVGSLDRGTIMSHVAKSFRGRQQLDFDSSLAGAGIGLVLIIKSGGSLCFVTEPGKKTEVTVFYRKASSMREFKNQFQFISTVVFDDL